MLDKDTSYINSTDYNKLKDKLKDLVSIMDELTSKLVASRRLRYTEIDVEGERKAGRLQPDEMYIAQHIIDTNIRREQSAYVQYVTQPQRAVVLRDIMSPANDVALIEQDVTQKVRFDGWQLSLYACIDGMQQNGYGVMEVVQDQNQPGEVAHECVQQGDFGFIADTRDLQEAEMIARQYFFPKTKLVALASDPESGWSMVEVNKVIGSESASTDTADGSVVDAKDKSLYRIYKVMFRVNGVVNVAWARKDRCDDWLRPPRPLFLGRRSAPVPQQQQPMMPQQQPQLPQTQESYETAYPYVIYPYLISENDTISQLKGRVYLDQDTQEAVSSLLSSFCTGHRRASGLYFSKDISDPNDDLMMQKNVFFQPGALINSKVTQFQLTPPNAEMVSAINLLVSGNQNETSQVNFAANNRKDSRKTATEVSAASQSAASLSTVQVVLFSAALRTMYSMMYDIIASRVIAGLIQVDPAVAPMYTRKYHLKPAGDTDVIERQQMVQQMMSAWPVVQNTPANVAFLSDLLAKMFPEQAGKYIQIFQQAQQQQQSQQAQQQQVMNQMNQQLASSVVNLSKHPEMFSDAGKVHALPAVQAAAQQIQQMMQPQQQPQAPQQ
jgi:hypothetical protein